MEPVSVTLPDVFADVLHRFVSLYEKVMGLPDARRLEDSVHDGLREIDQAFMAVCLKEKARQAEENDVREVLCPHCGQWATLLNPTGKRHIITVRGRVDFTRRVYQCSSRSCRKERAPFDEELGLAPKEHFSPLVQKKAAWAGAMLNSYEKGASDMSHQAEIAMSPKQVQRVTEKTGERALSMQESEVRHFGRPAAWDHVIEAEEKPETLVLEMDGTCVMGRDGEGHEVKCATVFGLDARARSGSPGKERPVLLRRSYCATSRAMAGFRSMVWALCVSWGIRSSRRVVIIGDGIDWIWNFSQDRFHFSLAGGGVSKPVEILDFYHASENLTKARNAIFRDPEGLSARQWYETWRQALWDGRVEDLIPELERRSKQSRQREAREGLRLRAEYFRKHAERMHYDQYRAEGLPIGSGAIEGTCKNLVKGRMACVGQRWGVEEGIERMMALRVRIFNERYDDLWQRQEQAAA